VKWNIRNINSADHIGVSFAPIQGTTYCCLEFSPIWQGLPVVSYSVTFFDSPPEDTCLGAVFPRLFARKPLLGRFTLYVTFPFRRGTSPFSNIFSRVITRRCSHWQERLRHVSVPFRRRCWARRSDVTERVRTGVYLLDSNNVNSLTSPPLHCDCFRLSEMDEKLMELVRKCGEFYMTCQIRSIVTVCGKKNREDK